ncbi:MAG: type II toxin-antitoxin system VapC family toxin [Opitutaceae bacterium]|nr:type II toxin-antitoxin system VapC family toxin [Opitutaceae bacterium]
MLSCDTSFLFSLYRKDAHTSTAMAFLARAAGPLILSSLNEYELGNALRFAEFRGLLPQGGAALRLEAFAEDRVAGRWHPSGITPEEILAEANAISDRHTLKGGHRAFDILHVAHAKLAGSKRFLSFDANQIVLAKAVGLAVGP